MLIYKGIKVYAEGNEIPENFEDIINCISSDLGNTKVNKIRIRSDHIYVELKNQTKDKTWLTVKLDDESDKYFPILVFVTTISLFLIFLV